MIKYLSQWIKHNVTVMSDRAFPNNPVELKVGSSTEAATLAFHLFLFFCREDV